MAQSDAPQRSNTPQVAAFMKAVHTGDAAAVRSMLAADRTLIHSHDYDSFGATPLIHAASRRDRAMVDLLLEHGADINGRSDWWAGSFGVLPHDDREMAEFLLSRGARLDAHAAAHMNKLDELRRMLDADPALVHARGGDGQFPLHYAATAEAIDLLLERGADIDGRDIDHESTAAQWQATRNPAATRHLISRGAAPDVFMAAACGHVDLLREMLAANRALARERLSEESFRTSDNTQALHIYFYTIGGAATPLHAAATAGQADAARVLLEAGADPNATGGYDDSTPLHLASWNNQVAVAEVLLDGGADINRRSGSMHDNEPLGWAIVGGRAEVVDLLLRRGAAMRPCHIEAADAGTRGAFRYTNATDDDFRRCAELVKAAAASDPRRPR